MVKSDHNSLKYFLGQSELNERQRKWVTKLQSYDFEIEFVNEKKNFAADALSRSPHFRSISIISADWKVKIMAEYVKNAWTSKLVDGSLLDDRYSLREGLIFYKKQNFYCI